VRLSLVVHALRLSRRVPTPQAPISLAGLTDWARQASATTEVGIDPLPTCGCAIPLTHSLSLAHSPTRAARQGFYIFTSFILLSNPAGSLSLVSQAILAAYHAASYTQSLNLRLLGGLRKKLAAHQPHALLVMGLCDVGVAVQLLVAAVVGGAGVRGGMQTLVYSNLLRQRSIAAESTPECSYYRTTWNYLGASPIGSVAKQMPFFGLVSGWFQGQRR